MHDFKTRVQDLTWKVKDGEEKVRKAEASRKEAENGKKEAEEKSKAVQVELEDLFVVLGDLEEKRSADKVSLISCYVLVLISCHHSEVADGDCRRQALWVLVLFRLADFSV